MYTKDRLSGKTDMRVMRTRKLLWNALLDLLEAREFDSLTVQEICDAAMVHRTTFYKHFEDKFALLSYGLAKMDELFAGTSYEERIFHPMRLMMRFADAKEFRVLAKAAGESSFLNEMLTKHGAEALKRDMLRAQANGMNFKVPVEMMAAFYSGAASGLCTWWMNDGARIPPEQIDDYLGLMINRNLFLPDKAPENAEDAEGPGTSA
ncbi:TetR/AcrR family transcriptional regulator [Cohnella sp. GCM10027633]|uniref:TetR/AcrR family transcriptional regulator n=1 Tax=unclassified Cohnella TaxID=2636738 RepID=UPI00363A0293